MAREFDRDLKLLVLDQPTRGLDVGSIEFIHRQVIAKRDAGTAVLLVSAELDEVLEMSDRIGVMYGGRIVAVMDGRTADKNEVGLLMATGGAERPDRRARSARSGMTTPARRPATRRRPPLDPRPDWAVMRACRSSSILLSLLVGAVVIVASELIVPARSSTRACWFTAYGALIQGAFGSADAIVQTLVYTAPLVLGGLAVAFGFKAGLFNIGAQGQFLVGALGGGHRRRGPGRRAGAGRDPGGDRRRDPRRALWGFIPGFLKAVSGAHEVVSTIMLNYVARPAPGGPRQRTAEGRRSRRRR